MSQTLRVALRRRLGGLRRALRPATRPARSPEADRLATDGGEPAERDDDEHLREVPDGAGCTEIWEYLSERSGREARADD